MYASSRVALRVGTYHSCDDTVAFTVVFAPSSHHDQISACIQIHQLDNLYAYRRESTGGGQGILSHSDLVWPAVGHPPPLDRERSRPAVKGAVTGLHITMAPPRGDLSPYPSLIRLSTLAFLSYPVLGQYRRAPSSPALG